MKPDGAAPSHVAVDVVLLPPAPVSRRAVAASARLQSRLRLGPRAVPHITLAMASLRAEDVPAVVAWLRGAARRHQALDLTIPRAVARPHGRHWTGWYEVARTPPLLALHRDAVRALERYRCGMPHRRMLAVPQGERVRAALLRFIARFGPDASGARYQPHVTLGYGVPLDEPGMPWHFRATRLALFQLGNHCTCARKIASVRLRGGISPARRG